jgi:ABC-type siderophore export system fused ATPase/permease subunit
LNAILGFLDLSEGHFLLNDVYEDSNLRKYIYNNVCYIGADYFNFGLYLRPNGEQADRSSLTELFERFSIDSALSSFDNGWINLTKLSMGQKGRAALASALYQDAQIYVFDEWAANQDLVHKNMFYNEILPELKRKKKFVIVVTHDEKYFGCCDNLWKMENGKAELLTKI